ncbi:hypothetical protein ACHAQD_008413 [Fusarium lateritium]
MAVLPEVPGFSISIRIAGQDADEIHLPISSDDDGIIYRYIECQTGPCYTIVCHCPADFPFNDNEDLLVLIGYKKAGVEQGPWKDEIAFRERDVGTDRPWREYPMFLDVALVEDVNVATIAADLNRVPFIGRITFLVEPGITTGEVQSFEDKVKRQHEYLDIAQKTLARRGQNVTHGTHFQAENGALGPQIPDIKAKPSRQIAAFCFQYMTRSSLESLGVIPHVMQPPAVTTGQKDVKMEVV